MFVASDISPMQNGISQAKPAKHLRQHCIYLAWAPTMNLGSSECDGIKVRNRSVVEYMKKTCHVRRPKRKISGPG